MGSIPLVALSVRTPNAIQDASAAQQLQGTRQVVQQQAALAPGQQQQQQQNLQLGQQAIQQGQFAVQDREAGMKAMQQWDGKDPNQIPDLIKQNGGSLQAVLGAKKAAIENQQSILNLNTAKLAQSKTQNDYLLGKLQAASDPSVPDSQLAQSLMNAGQDAVKDGYLDPPHAQQLQQFIQQYPDPKDLRTQLGIYEKGLQSQSEQFAQEQKNRETTAAENTANARKVAADTGAQRLAAEMPGGALASVDKTEMASWLADNPGKKPEEFLAYKASLAPNASKAAQAEGVGGPNDAMVDMVGQNKMDLATAFSRMPPSAKIAFSAALASKYPDFSQGDFGVSKDVQKKYTSGNVADQLLAISTAREHMKTFNQLSDAMDNGDVQALNKIGNKIGVQFGSDKATNQRIAAQAFGGEVGRAFDGAGVVAGERDKAQANMADYLSKGQFKGAIQTVDQLLAGKQKAAQEAYASGRKAQPNFGGGAQGGGQTQSGAPTTPAAPVSTTADPFSQFGGKKH